MVGVFLEDIPKSVRPVITKLYTEMTSNHLTYPMKPKINVGELIFLLLKPQKAYGLSNATIMRRN